jgi:hypothetical protein
MIARDTFLSRFRYLSLDGEVGVATFGFDRHLNQSFYASRDWKNARDMAILRDQGCDLGVPGHDIHGRILVHHMNPITPEDLNSNNFNPDILDPEYLICVSDRTHNAIHFADESQLPSPMVERRPGDTIGWTRMW